MKLWNKIALFGIVCVMLSCILPLQVKAGNILTAQATGQTTQVEVTGQADTGVLAVVVQVRDSSDNILTMETFPVKSDSTYQATLQLDLAAGEYKVYVADFDGGDWKTADFTVTAATGGGTGGTGGSGSGSGAGGNTGSGGGSSNGSGDTGNSGSGNTGSSGSGDTGNNGGSSSGSGDIGNSGGSTGSGSNVSGGNTNGSGNNSVGESDNVEENSKDNTESSYPGDSNIGEESGTKIPNMDTDKDSDEVEALSENVRDSQDGSSVKPWTIVLIIILVIGLVLVIGGVVYLRNRRNDDI